MANAECMAQCSGAPFRFTTINMINMRFRYFYAITVCMYVCMYGHTYSKSMDQPGKVASPARGQLNREN